MPTREAPADVNQPEDPSETAPVEESPASDGSSGYSRSTVRGSRWVDYDTHELMQVISELEDERRWARLREGILWAILFHIFLLSAFTWIPRYVFKVPPVTDPFDAIKQRKDLTYLDLPPDALRQLQHPKIPKPVERKPLIDQKMLDELKRETPPAPAAPPPPPAASEPQAPATPKPQPTQPLPPNPQSQLDAPRPTAVPARPNFAMESQNPSQALQDAMRSAMQNRGKGVVPDQPMGGLSMHPGASGGVQILSPTNGVDFSSWLARWHYETERTWDPLIPDEVNPPINKAGMVAIEFKVLPNGRLMPDSVQLVGRSGDTALDRAAWGALTGSSYPPLPSDFHGPYLELRAYFLYNMQPQ
jgi:outer membrane biosynthesis protein TonB